MSSLRQHGVLWFFFYWSLPSSEELLGEAFVGVRRQHSLNKVLQSTWTHRCRIHFHADQPPIKRLDNVFRPSKCLLHGLCICGKHEGSCPDAWFFSQNMTRWLQSIFFKKQKIASPARKELENNTVVLAFTQMPAQETEGLDATVHYVHVGYINFSTWNYAAWRLYSDLELLQLDPGLHEETGALQVGPLDPDSAGASFGVLTDLQFYKEVLILEKPWQVQPYVISHEEKHWCHLDSSSSIIPLVPLLPDMPACCVWQGSEKEAENRHPQPKKRRQRGPRAATDGAGSKRQRAASGKRETDPAAESPAATATAAASSASIRAVDRALQPDDPAAAWNSHLDPYAENDAAFDDADAVENDESARQTFRDLAVEAGNPLHHGSECSADSLDPLFDEAEGDRGEAADACDEFVAGASLDVEDRLVDLFPKPSAGQPDSDEPVPAAAAVAPARGPAARAEGVRRRQNLDTEEVTFAEYGRIRYYPQQKICIAVCANPDHGQCRMERTCSANSRGTNPGQGRPIGLLAAWLRCHAEFPTQQSHLREFKHTHESRVEARSQFMLMDGAAAFCRLAERPMRDGEAEEPNRVR